MITLVTGANKGLGYEAARRLIEAGHTVVIGARDQERGQKAAEELGARFVQLEVTNDASIAAAMADINENEGHLDVLVNNAGVSEGMHPIEEITGDLVQRIFDTNVVGIFRVTTAALPLLRKSEHAVIVNVSSGLGSFTRTHDDQSMESQVIAPVYTSSKAAVSMMTTQYAKALPEMRVNAVDPGFTSTDLNNGAGVQTVTEGTDAIVAMATIGPDGPTGTFTDRNGAVGW